MTAALSTLLLSILLCGVYLRYARARQLVDIPNERSSHTLPTPHAGGAALILAFALGLLLADRLYGAWEEPYVTLAVATLLLMVFGLIDDLRNLSVQVRLVVYGLVCLGVAGDLLQLLVIDSVPYGWVVVPFAALTMLWALNLYNFMDGIDGIAALQTVLACCCAALLSWIAVRDSSYALYCLLLAAAHGGFLVWNFPPARLFMGDAGSVPTGFLLAGLTLLGAQQGQLNPLCWLVLLAVFVTDASWTLVWRMVTGQAFTKPHRLHAYQRLSRHWGSHLGVDTLLVAINVLWLYPLAAAVQMWPDLALFLVILAYLPLLCGMAKMGKLA